MAVIITFLQNAIRQGICILFGANGEILTEKSGNLNLGVPGMMYMGGIGASCWCWSLRCWRAAWAG